MVSMTRTTGPAASESLVDRHSHFDGLYRTEQNLRVEGVAEGEIQCEGTLMVEEGARVKAKVTANTISVAGELEGEVSCRDTFKIMPTGQVEATVTARRLIVEEGGFYNGQFKMIVESSPAAAGKRSGSDLSAEDWRSSLPSLSSWTEKKTPDPEEEG